MPQEKHRTFLDMQSEKAINAAHSHSLIRNHAVQVRQPPSQKQRRALVVVETKLQTNDRRGRPCSQTHFFSSFLEKRTTSARLTITSRSHPTTGILPATVRKRLCLRKLILKLLNERKQLERLVLENRMPSITGAESPDICAIDAVSIFSLPGCVVQQNWKAGFLQNKFSRD